MVSTFMEETVTAGRDGAPDGTPAMAAATPRKTETTAKRIVIVVVVELGS
jgi:hypothetical protein